LSKLTLEKKARLDQRSQRRVRPECQLPGFIFFYPLQLNLGTFKVPASDFETGIGKPLEKDFFNLYDGQGIESPMDFCITRKGE
jgi:hypothetical protein